MANTLAQFQTDNQALSLMQNSWATALNPLLRNPALQTVLLQNVSLAVGSNTINHLLGRKLQGWQIVRKRADASIYDTQDSNQMPELTLLLTTDAAVVCDLLVF